TLDFAKACSNHFQIFLSRSIVQLDVCTISANKDDLIACSFGCCMRTYTTYTSYCDVLYDPHVWEMYKDHCKEKNWDADSLRVIIKSQCESQPNVLDNDLSVFPCPSPGEINIKGNVQNQNIIVANVQGKQFESFYFHKDRQNRLDLTSMPNGTYILTYESNGKLKAKRFVIQK
ncbi:MAG: T9SS type A sorting domain-containing protein, partial [Flavobacteriales bacterium]|nr:T9SS type A sorting domain-containing protein [Flavobacteriales bacterium]